jgi:hypothetical protein
MRSTYEMDQAARWNVFWPALFIDAIVTSARHGSPRIKSGTSTVSRLDGDCGERVLEGLQDRNWGPIRAFPFYLMSLYPNYLLQYEPPYTYLRFIACTA